MQSKKIAIACLSIMLVALTIPTYNLPEANASSVNSSFAVTVSGVLSGATDPNHGSVNEAQAGSTVTVNVVIQASSLTPSYQRNVTFGFKGDWMTAYQNASSSTTPLQSNQIGSATISVAMPSAGGPGSLAHTWTRLPGPPAECIATDIEIGRAHVWTPVT